MKANNTSTGTTVSSLKNAVSSSASNRSFAAAGKPGGMAKIIMYVLCQDELYKTDGTTTYLQDIYDIDELRELGPMIEQIRVHYVCEGASTNFVAKVTLMWSVLGKTWSTSADILTAQTSTNTGTISFAMTTTTQFGVLMRYAVEIKNASGALTESGRVTAILEIQLKS